jgi:hypothetical protein
MSIRLFYDHWPQYQRRLVDVVAEMSSDERALRPDPTRAPVWAIVAHIAGTRVYWLCGVLGVPGAETTPFPDPYGDGWEDDEDSPRGSSDLVTALESTWRIVAGCLDDWTPEMLGTDLGPAETLQSRCLPLRRVVTDARDRRVPSDRPLGR